MPKLKQKLLLYKQRLQRCWYGTSPYRPSPFERTVAVVSMFNAMRLGRACKHDASRLNDLASRARARRIQGAA